jgi:hypothetical protein
MDLTMTITKVLTKVDNRKIDTIGDKLRAKEEKREMVSPMEIGQGQDQGLESIEIGLIAAEAL